MIIETLLENLIIYEPNSFELSGPLLHTIETIRIFAKEMLLSTDKDVQSLSLSLLATIGLLCGSVKLVVEVIQLMMQYKVILHTKVLTLLKKCSEIDPDFNIAFPNNKVWCNSIFSYLLLLFN